MQIVDKSVLLAGWGAAIAALMFGPELAGTAAWGQPSTDWIGNSGLGNSGEAIADPPAIYAEQMPENHSSVLLSEAGGEGEGTGAEVSPQSGNGSIPQSDRGDRLQFGFGSDDPRGFGYGFGSRLVEPTALFGGTRIQTVSAEALRDLFFPVRGYVQQGLGPNQRLLLELLGDLDLNAVAADLVYSISPAGLPGTFSLNLQSQSNLAGAFENGDTNVSLPSGADPHVNQWGGGLEYFQALTPQFDIASGINYRVVSVRNGVFSNDVFSVDELGNPVTVSDDGIDPLLSVNLAAVLNAVDDRTFPTRGTRLRFSLEQSIPIGDADIEMTQLAANVSQFIPLLGSENPHILILNAQGGTILNDVPPYAAFSLGGNSTIRGFDTGDAGTSSSFVQATVEYRYPISSFTVFGSDIKVRGAVFVDYGDTLGTQGEVIGQPGEARDKDGEGLGYGLGFHFRTAFGLFRLEPALSDNGDFNFHFSVGDRF
ncbi:BamA/TamA family outer membrane protein [Synechococcus sp. PCC 7336]|uniref:BamA/TamA family outer membrane protein n=1 Tax=Synechococcus sp. PCC 7336 TaxID=195250 RepID=UPI00034BD6D8|nr:BamA/TamA family outer membrane protein [Synechococcus sp. PCC 7336]